MKKILTLAALLLVLSPFINGQAIPLNEKKPVGKVTSADFEGEWRGEEKCQNISAPVAKIIVTPRGEYEVSISGLYSTVGPVVGTVKNNVITIPRQIVPDPVFKNLKIQGNLTLSKNRKAIQGIYIILNNDARDDCGANYHR